MTPCSLVGSYRYSGGTYYLRVQSIEVDNHLHCVTTYNTIIFWPEILCDGGGRNVARTVCVKLDLD
jgi:hypothetical protein